MLQLAHCHATYEWDRYLTMLRTLAKRPPVPRSRHLDSTMFSPVQRRGVSENTIVHPEDKNLIPIKTNLKGMYRSHLSAGTADRDR